MNKELSPLGDKPLHLVDQFMYFDSNISSTESKINKYLVKAWTAIEWSSYGNLISGKIKEDSFQAVAVLALLYGCTICMLMKQSKS